MSKYTTLVFKSDTPESLKATREASLNEHCRGWSMDHEILRLELIEQALEEGDIEKAKSYIGEVDVTRFLDRLSATQAQNTDHDHLQATPTLYSTKMLK